MLAEVPEANEFKRKNIFSFGGKKKCLKAGRGWGICFCCLIFAHENIMMV